MVLFRKNYFYELPEDIQNTIYKIIFNTCVYDIQNDKNIKYIDRLYRTTNNPNNTCIYSIKPQGMFSNIEKEYKYKRVVALEDYRNNKMSDMIYLDREHLIEKTSQLDIYTISYFVHPLLATSKTFKKYLTIRINLSGYYDKEIIKYSMICLKKISLNKYKYINNLMDNKYEYNYDKIRKNFKYILEMDNKVEIINKLIDKDIKRIKSDDILINHIIDDEELEEIFREKCVHFVEIIDQEDKNKFIDEMEKELKGEIIFYES